MSNLKDGDIIPYAMIIEIRLFKPLTIKRWFEERDHWIASWVTLRRWYQIETCTGFAVQTYFRGNHCARLSRHAICRRHRPFFFDLGVRIIA